MIAKSQRVTAEVAVSGHPKTGFNIVNNGGGDT